MQTTNVITIKSAALVAALFSLTQTGCDLQPASEPLAGEAPPRSAPYSADLPAGLWAERGRLIAHDHVRTLSRQEIREAQFDLPFADSYASFGLDDFFDFYDSSEIDQVVRFRVEVHRVIYETVDPWGQPTTASGAVLIPRSEGGPTGELALWALMRGTVFYDDDVPSHGDTPDWGIWRGLLPAAAGYVIAMPDYLGFGASRHLVHPYLIREPSATAAIDMLRASRQLAAELGQPLRDEVFVSGHSQGGHATLATVREIEAAHADEFELAGAAPSSGPYAFSGILDALLASDTLFVPQVTSLYTLSLVGTYELGQPLSYYFQAPYDELVLDLFDKTKTNAEISAALPAGTTDTLFTDAFLTAYRGDGALEFKAAVAGNDVHTGWTPQTPIRLYHGSADSAVPPIQSQLALAGLAGDGVDIEIELIDGAEHLQTIVPATLRTIEWFDSLLDAPE